MNQSRRVNVYDTRGSDYQRAFQVFLDHTDQKTKAKDWLTRFVERLPARRVFIDAGAGNGKVTAWFIEFFERTIAIEPNPHLRQELIESCPKAEALTGNITDTTPGALADLVLCSHVFYYIPIDAWMDNLKRIVSWLTPDGSAVVVAQNHDTDCMKMLKHFLGASFNLSSLAAKVREELGETLKVQIDTVKAHITTTTLENACIVAEFMLNLLPMPIPPLWTDVENYVADHFAIPGGTYRFSCHQDFLQVRRKKS